MTDRSRRATRLRRKAAHDFLTSKCRDGARTDLREAADRIAELEGERDAAYERIKSEHATADAMYQSAERAEAELVRAKELLRSLLGETTGMRRALWLDARAHGQSGDYAATETAAEHDARALLRDSPAAPKDSITLHDPNEIVTAADGTKHRLGCGIWNAPPDECDCATAVPKEDTK